MTKRKDPKDYLKIGRPTKYNESMNDTVYKLAALFGATDKKICAILNISPASFYNYQKKNPEFLERLRAGKGTTDLKVVSTLLKRVLGYSYTETITKSVEGKGGVTRDTDITLKKEVPPDVPAIIFWLTNRQPELWKRVPEPGEDDKSKEAVNITFNGIDPIQAANYYKKLMG